MSGIRKGNGPGFALLGAIAPASIHTPFLAEEATHDGRVALHFCNAPRGANASAQGGLQ
jgi:hypothetical protein